MNVIDIVVLILSVIALIDGYRKGIVRTLGAIAGIVCGIYIAKAFTVWLSPWLQTLFRQASLSLIHVISFVLLFLVILIIFRILAKFIDKLLSAIMLGWVNRIAGAVFSVLVCLFVISIVFNVYEYFDPRHKWISREYIFQSFTYEPVLKFAPSVFPFLKFNEWKDKLNKPNKERTGHQSLVSLHIDINHGKWEDPKTDILFKKLQTENINTGLPLI